MGEQKSGKSSSGSRNKVLADSAGRGKGVSVGHAVVAVYHFAVVVIAAFVLECRLVRSYSTH